MKNFIGKYQQQEQENQVFLGKKLEIQVNLFIQGFNCQEQMTFYYLNALGMWEYNERNFDKVLMQACVKISYLLYNAHQLLLRGEYGVANILLRQVFEYLVIGKYFYKQQNEIWAEKWLEDRKYEVYDKILRLLKIPDKKHLCDFWKVLCSRSLKDAFLLNSQQINIRFALRYLQVFVALRLKTCRLYDKQDLSSALIVQFVGRPTEPQTSLVSARRQD